MRSVFATFYNLQGPARLSRLGNLDPILLLKVIPTLIKWWEPPATFISRPGFFE